MMIVENPTLQDLLDLTKSFFHLHWNSVELGNPPNWSELFSNFVRMPNYLKAGLYAFVKNNEITYIGVGASKGGGIYPERGLSRRFQSYVKVNKEKNEPYIVDVRLQEAREVVTIGFESEHAYLAYGLEAFLISRLNPKYNKVGKKLVNSPK